MVQVCDVNKCLLSVARLNEANQLVVLDGPKSFIQDKESGEKVRVDYHNKSYTLRAWVRPNDSAVTFQPPTSATATGFHRQE